MGSNFILNLLVTHGDLLAGDPQFTTVREFITGLCIASKHSASYRKQSVLDFEI